MEYVNLVAVGWLMFNIVYTTCMMNNNIGRRIVRVNIIPFLLSIASLITLGITVIEALP